MEFTFTMKLLALVTASLLSASTYVNAMDNYTVTFKLYDKEKNEILTTSSLLADVGRGSNVNSMTYAITECSKTGEKETKSFRGKKFLSGYSYSVNPNSGAFEFVEYGIDDSKYNAYDKAICFNDEVKQLKSSITQKVIVGKKEFQDFVLPNGNTLKVAIYN